MPLTREQIKENYGTLSEGVLRYFAHIRSFLDGEEDYNNKKLVLSRLCSGGELEEAVACLDSMEWIRND